MVVEPGRFEPGAEDEVSGMVGGVDGMLVEEPDDIEEPDDVDDPDDVVGEADGFTELSVELDVELDAEGIVAEVSVEAPVEAEPPHQSLLARCLGEAFV